MRLSFTLATVGLLLVSASITHAQDAITETKKLETVAEDRTPATNIDFSSELQIPLQALSDLGRSIEEARDEADPIRVASAANILAAAESMAGDKKASVTSKQLWSEAIALAEKRNSSTELAVLASLTSGDIAADLKERSQAAEEEEQANMEAEAAGEVEKDLNGDLHVYNRSCDTIRIYIEGEYYGKVRPHSSATYRCLHHVYELEARSCHKCWHEHVDGNRCHYDWVIRDRH